MSERSEGAQGKCPICGKVPAREAARFTPFCGRRCADLDLGRWLKGSYAIPAAPDEAESPDASPGQVPEEE